ncbi:hypothetical protein GLW08_03190 [Pontibacillus yanchengensis]|uniref:Uncharacterized protein n=2 Tax=Pontibacillus yanchengensis TaxID=462910 RepID=A0ACC7VC48_9BACI|nr:hypothetical protein [Pontibacillus yanchengensis]MYL35309.1 hypothetical protein [Pontibacillus yanchengensis]MYL52338.1 hypothetical protein [Pontibacillus yanchengensis]
MWLLLALSFITIAVINGKHIYKHYEKIDLVVFSLFYFLSTMFAVALFLELPIPSPLKGITFIYQPLLKLLSM